MPYPAPKMKEKIIAFMKDMHSHDARRVAEWFSEESMLWIPPSIQVTGCSRIKALFRAMFSRYDFLEWTIIDILPIDDMRCIHICDSHGKLKGREAYRNRVITDIVFNDAGKIVSLSDYFKDTSVFCAES